MDIHYPDLFALIRPQQIKATIGGKAGVADLKAYAYTGGNKLIAALYSGTPESVQGIRAYMSSGDNESLFATNEQLFLNKAVYKHVVVPFHVQRQAACLSLHPTVLDFQPGKDEVCYVLADSPEIDRMHLISDWFAVSVGRRITSIVDVAVLPHWYKYLIQHGEIEGLMTKAAWSVGMTAWEISTNAQGWEYLISYLLKNNIVHFDKEV